MTKEVLISISGLQFEIEEDEAVEVITAGEYHYRNNKHYIIYEDMLDDFGVTKNTIKISDKKIDIMKKGASNVNMVFEAGKPNQTYYNTPFGNLLIGINTTKIAIDEDDNQINVQIEYRLDVNYTFVADCVIKIKITSKS